MNKQSSTVSEADKNYDLNFYKGNSVNNNYPNTTFNNNPSYNNFNFGVR